MGATSRYSAAVIKSRFLMGSVGPCSLSIITKSNPLSPAISQAMVLPELINNPNTVLLSAILFFRSFCFIDISPFAAFQSKLWVFGNYMHVHISQTSKIRSQIIPGLNRRGSSHGARKHKLPGLQSPARP